MTLVWFLLALVVLVTVHEWGHFYVARRCGVKVLRFSVGFGKPLLVYKDRLGTEYTLALIPLGGYVKMLDEREAVVAPSERPQAFTQKTVWQRMAIVAAGPIANFILAFLLYTVLALMGGKGVAPIIGSVTANSAAGLAGLQPRDEILQVDGRPVTTWSAVFDRLLHRVGETGTIRLLVKPHDAPGAKQRIIEISIHAWLRDAEVLDVLASLGIHQYMPPQPAVVAEVIAPSAAASAGIRAGDKILAVNGQLIESWQQWARMIRSHPEELLALEVERDQSRLYLSLRPDAVMFEGQRQGRAGVKTQLVWPENMLRSLEFSLSEAIVRGAVQTYERAISIIAFIKKLLFAEISSRHLGGSFTIAEAAGSSAKMGISNYLFFLAALSVSLGVFNLLPVPMLDGGHLLYYIIEALKGSPVSQAWQARGYKVGLLVVLGVMILAHVNDAIRFFS